MFDLTPITGKPTEVLHGGPLDGMIVRKTKKALLITGNEGMLPWYALYTRKDGKLEYLVSVSPMILLAINPKHIPTGIG